MSVLGKAFLVYLRNKIVIYSYRVEITFTKGQTYKGTDFPSLAVFFTLGLISKFLTCIE